MREIHLVAIACADVVVNALESLRIMLGREVGSNLARYPERRAKAFFRRLAETVNQLIPFSLRFRIAAAACEVTAARMMIHHHRPVVNADSHFREFLDVFGNHRQPLQPARQIIAEITQRSAAKWQIAMVFLRGFEIALKQDERVFGGKFTCAVMAYFGQFAARDQSGIGLRHQNIVARVRGISLAAVEKRRPRQVGNRFKQTRAVFVIRKFG